MFEKIKKIDENKLDDLTNDFIQCKDHNEYQTLLELTKYLKECFIESQSKKRAVLVPVNNEANSTIEINEDDVDDEIIQPISQKKKTYISDNEKAGLKKLQNLHEQMIQTRERVDRYNEKNVSIRHTGSVNSAPSKADYLTDKLMDLMTKFLKVGNRFPQLIQNNPIYKLNFKNIKQVLCKERKNVNTLDPVELTSNKCFDEKIVEFCRNLKETPPDLKDIEKVIIQTNKDLNKGVSNEHCKELAFQAFEKIIRNKKVKREKYDNECFFGSYEDPNEQDPSMSDENLKLILEKNAKIGAKNFNNVLDEFCKRENEENEDVRERTPKSKRICLSNNNDDLYKLPKILNILSSAEDPDVIIID